MQRAKLIKGIQERISDLQIYMSRMDPNSDAYKMRKENLDFLTEKLNDAMNSKCLVIKDTKYGIELNGVANLHLLVDKAFNDHVPMITQVEQYIKEQLILLERYMIAFSDSVSNQVEPPKWHEVRENPSKYPTNKERFSK